MTTQRSSACGLEIRLYTRRVAWAGDVSERPIGLYCVRGIIVKQEELDTERYLLLRDLRHKVVLEGNNEGLFFLTHGLHT